MKKNDKDIISRRNFFKRSAQILLPTVAAIALPSLLTSCEIDQPQIPSGGESGCKTCSGACVTGCNDGCTSQCTSCMGSCSGKHCGNQCTSCINTCSIKCSKVSYNR